MTRQRTRAYIQALTSGRRPRGFRASDDDVAVVRTAIELKTSLAKAPPADEHFVSSLFDRLAREQWRRPRAAVPPRQPVAWVALVAASAAALVGATIVSTQTLDHRAAAPATPAAQDQGLRTGALWNADNRRVGQISVYRGHPSWVFVNVEGSSYNGSVICKLQAVRAVTVASGIFEVNHGTGQFARTIRVDVTEVRSAELVSPSGAIVAKAVFS